MAYGAALEDDSVKSPLEILECKRSSPTRLGPDGAIDCRALRMCVRFPEGKRKRHPSRGISWRVMCVAGATMMGLLFAEMFYCDKIVA
jgi:hypothetical protein